MYTPSSDLSLEFIFTLPFGVFGNKKLAFKYEVSECVFPVIYACSLHFRMCSSKFVFL